MQRLRVCLLALTALFFARGTVADDAIPSARRLPPQVLAHVTLSSVPKFNEQWGKTLIGQMGKEESLVEFVRELSAQFKKLSGKVEAEIGLNLEELLAIPQGEIAFAVIGLPGKKLAPTLLFDFGDKQESIEKLLEKGVAFLEENGAKHSEEEFEETRIHILKKPAEESDADAKKNRRDASAADYFDTLAYCLKDRFLLAGTSVDAVKSVLSRWDGKHEQTFAENEVYRYILERGRDENSPPPIFAWFIDPVGLGKSIATAQQPVSMQTTMALAMLPKLGLDKLKAIGGSGDMVQGDFDSINRVLIYMEPPPTGVLNLFQFTMANLAPPKWVSAQSAAFYAINWDLEKAFAAVESLVDSFQGPGSLAAQIDKFAENEELGNLHVKKDVIDLLSGKTQVVVDFADADKAESQRVLIAMEVKNVPGFKATLAKIAKISGFPGKPREFQGELILEIPLPSVGDDEKGKAIGISVTENHLMIATDVTILEDAMRGSKDETLAESPVYRKLAAKFPTQTSSISFSRQDMQIKSVYDMLRSGQMDQLFGEDEEFKLDFSKLPPFDEIKKFLPPTASYMVSDPRGLLFINFSLRNE